MNGYNLDNPFGDINKTENLIDPYEYPKTRVRYLSKMEFLEWSNGKEWE